MRQKIQTIKLQGGKGIEVEVDWNARKKCKCGTDIWFAKTTNGKLMPIELVGLAEWDTHFVSCPLAKKFRRLKS